jgi:hypothetical protein
MRKIALLAVVGIAALAATAPVSAKGPPMPANGTAVSTLFIFTAPPQFADGNTITFVHREGLISGTIVGAYSQDLRAVQHPDGLIDIQGSGTITGTIGICGSGTVHVGVTARFDPAVGGDVHIESIKQNDDTVDAHLNLFITGGLTGVATYSGNYMCG